MDASVLIELRNKKKLGRLAQPIRNGRVAVPLYVLNKLRRSAKWRSWLERNEENVKTRLNKPQEHQLYAQLSLEHATGDSNPHLAADDIMALTIAKCRNLPLAMRDANAERVASSLGISILHYEELLNVLAGQPARKLL